MFFADCQRKIELNVNSIRSTFLEMHGSLLDSSYCYL